ncbi:MAG: spore germination protein [Erysipelotrichales bacterium]|nr:spore germination protein [Erysipelotrichales bacterium]
MQTSQVSYKALKGKVLEYKSKSFDVSFREFTHLDKYTYAIAYLSSMSDELQITLMIDHLLSNQKVPTEKDLIILGNISVGKEIHQIEVALFSGLLIFLADNDTCYIIENRKYPLRSISEPETEKSVRSSRDGFIESFLLNIGLIRKRIRDPHLTIKTFQLGEKTHVDVGVMYLEDIVDQEILSFTLDKFSKIDQKDNIINEQQLAEYIFNSRFNPYPFVRYTERVDIASIHLLQGKIIVVIDNSPSVIILPTTFFEQCKAIEEYTQTNWIGTWLVLLRFSGILASLYLLPIWAILVALEFQGVPFLHIPTVDSVPMFGLRLLICDLVVEVLRLAMIHSPVLLTGVIGIIAAFLLGQMSIDLGYFTAEMILYVAIANMGTFITPGYELSMANKFARIVMILFIIVFSSIGGVIGIILHILLLANMKSGNFHYLYPLYPFSLKEFLQVFLRFEPIKTTRK